MGEFGDEYSLRNDSDQLISSNLALFSRILQRMEVPKSILELGANIGLNLTALQILLPNCDLTAVEINEAASKTLSRRIPSAVVVNTSIAEFSSDAQYDLVLAKGVLIHINPDQLVPAILKMLSLSSRYLIMCEYYSPRYETVTYRGHQERLYKGDFAGLALDLDSDLRLVDYGFAYRRDPCFPMDDFSWFLLEKQQT